MRIGFINASMQPGTGLRCGYCIRANTVLVVMTAGSEGGTDDTDEKDERKNQSNGLFHGLYPPFLYENDH